MIFALILRCLLISGSYSLPLDHSLRKKRIINGKHAVIIPYQVSIELNGNHLCGGSIISKKIILTAAHCVHGQNIKELSIRAGSSKREDGGILISVEHYTIHPDFQWMPNNFDVAIIFLCKSLTFGTRIHPISIRSDRRYRPGAKVLISGWGYEKENSGYLSDDLLYGIVNILDDKICKKYYDNFMDSMLCAGNMNTDHGALVDACNRDSGGPLVSGKKLIGIISSGIACAHHEVPAVYMNVGYFKKWIHKVVKNYESQQIQ